MKKRNLGIWIFVGIFVLIILAFFAFNNSTSDSLKNSVEKNSILEKSWVEIELKDVRTQQTFKISDFVGKPILLEIFAVWCPTCTKQQGKVNELHEEIGDKFVSISLNTDPNEDEARIQEHLDRTGFDWYYAVSPIELTEALIDEFGIWIVNAPSAPMILICEDGSFRKLKNGVKDVEELKSELNKC